MLYIRKSEKEDLGRLMEIYRIAQDYMIKSGNPNQWGHFNPTEEMIAGDIEKGNGYVIFDDNGIHGVFACISGADPTYEPIYEGSWLNDGDYLTIHRIAGDGEVHGIFRTAVDYAKSRIDNVRIDTHEDNKTMQHLMEKNGFKRCGIIFLKNGSPRIAYHWAKDRD